MKPPKKAHIAGGARAGRTAPSLSRTRSVPAGAVFQSLVTRRGRTHRYLRVLYLSNFILRLAFGFVLLTLPFYVVKDPRFQSNTLLAVAVIAVPYPFAEMLTANWFGSISDKGGRKRGVGAGAAGGVGGGGESGGFRIIPVPGGTPRASPSRGPSSRPSAASGSTRSPPSASRSSRWRRSSASPRSSCSCTSGRSA